MTDRIRMAVPEDSGEILRILESSASEGQIELLYTRRPDAYASYMQEAGEARVFVSTDGDRIVGTAAEIVREVYIGGEIKKAAYICGLKKDPDYTGTGFGLRFIRALAQDEVDLCYCSVISDNETAWKMFEKGRRTLQTNLLGEYTTHILNPKVKVRAPKHPYLFRQANEADLPALLAFLNREGSCHDLFPAISSLHDFHNLSVTDFYILTDEARILAAAALWDQTSYRQYIVKHYRGLLKHARRLNPILSALGYIRLPCEDQPLEFPMLSFFLTERDDMTYFRIHLKELMKVAAERYGMCVIGLPKSHPAASTVRRLPGIRFDTRLYTLKFPWSKPESGKVSPQSIFPECGLL